jgi:molybdopterin converting factor small subunit
MAITVKALRPLAEWLGEGKIELIWPGGTLEDLVHLLIDRKGHGIEKELKAEDGSFAYLVSINGKVHRDLTTPIQDGDDIFFFTPMGGG